MNKIYVEKNSFCTRLYIGTDKIGYAVSGINDFVNICYLNLIFGG